LPVNIATKTTIIVNPNIMKSTASQSGKVFVSFKPAFAQKRLSPKGLMTSAGHP
jgi:hypothetical protein